MRVLDWWALTMVSPTVAKSPTCAVARLPNMDVALVTKLS